MKIIIEIFCTIGIVLMCSLSSAQVADFESTTDGMLVPRMTTLQKEAIVNTSQSLLVYDTDTKSFWYYEDMQWNELNGDDSILGLDFGAASPNMQIPDGAPGVESTITLTSPEVINANTNIEICVDILHPFLGVVSIEVTAPDGMTNLDLSSDNGGSSDNYTNTCFTTSAVTLITSGTGPFTGDFIPEQAFSDLIGQNIAGDWILTVSDADTFIDLGTFLSWSIAFSEEEKEKLISDADADTRVLVEKNPDDDVIRAEVGGVEVMTLNSTDVTSTLPVTAPAFIGDGSQLTNLPSSGGGGGCTKYGDGSAGIVNIASNTNWAINPPSDGNYMFQNLTISSGQTLTVISGTVIMISENFVNNGTIEVLPGIEGARPNLHSNGIFPRIDGYTLTQFIPYAPEQFRFLLNPSFLAGANGEDGSIPSTLPNPTQESGSGGGVLIIRAGSTMTNTGTINAAGGDAIPHNVPTGDFGGAGGGGGGFVILLSPTITNSGVINVSGGNGSDPGSGDDDHAGGGGGGGLVHFVSGNANAVGGTNNISGGAPGVTPGANLGTSGGDGGCSAGAPGLGGSDESNTAGTLVQPEPGGIGIVLRTQVVEPCNLSFD